MLQFVILVSLLALAFAAILSFYILKKPAGSAKMQEISDIIYHGALTFLRKEYEVLAVYIVIVAAILYFIPGSGIKVAISFIIGGISSALAGNIGMRISTKSNARTAE